MLTIRRANILQILKLNKIISNFNRNKESFNFYSPMKGKLFSYLLTGNVYFIIKKNSVQGILILDNFNKNISYFPTIEAISVFKLLHLLKKHFDTSGYKIILNYKKINIDVLKKYFPISVCENMMYMQIDNSKSASTLNYDASLLVRNLEINKEESIRVELQNKIFENVENRCALTLDEVLSEQNNPRFLKNFCYILEVYREPSGYGQILKFDDKYFLVNFGVLADHRKNGYGYYFLHNILRECSKSGIKELYLSVDKKNENAINLYKKIGFKELYNLVTIKFK